MALFVLYIAWHDEDSSVAAEGAEGWTSQGAVLFQHALDRSERCVHVVRAGGVGKGHRRAFRDKGARIGLLPGPLPDGSQQPFFFLLGPAPTFLRHRAQSTDPV